MLAECLQLTSSVGTCKEGGVWAALPPTLEEKRQKVEGMGVSSAQIQMSVSRPLLSLQIVTCLEVGKSCMQ